MTTMTVGELKAYLAALPDDAPVFIETKPAKGPESKDDWDLYDIADVEPILEDAIGKSAFAVLRVSLDPASVVTPDVNGEP